VIPEIGKHTFFIKYTCNYYNASANMFICHVRYNGIALYKDTHTMTVTRQLHRFFKLLSLKS